MIFLFIESDLLCFTELNYMGKLDLWKILA